MAERRRGTVDSSRRDWDHTCTGPRSCGGREDSRDESGARAAKAAGPRGKNAGAGAGTGRSGKAGGALGRETVRDDKAGGREHETASEGGRLGDVHVLVDDAGEMLTDAEEIALDVARDGGDPGRRLRGGDERDDEIARVVLDLILHTAGDGGRERGGGGEEFGFRYNVGRISEDVVFEVWVDFRQDSFDEFDLAWAEFQVWKSWGFLTVKVSDLGLKHGREALG